MKVVSSLAVLCSLVAFANADQCDDLCAVTKRSLNAREACAQEVNMLPRPKVGSLCTEAFGKAFDDTCRLSCRTGSGGGGSLNTDALQIAKEKACAYAINATPRPSCKNSCFRGYERGVAATTKGLDAALSELSESERDAIAELAEAYNTATTANTPAAAAADDTTADTEKVESLEDVKAEPVVPTGERSSKTETVEGTGTDTTVGIKPDIAAAPAHSNVPPSVTAAAETTTTAATTTNTASGEASGEFSAASAPVAFTVPTTINGSEVTLTVHEGESSETAVAAFCSAYMPDEIAGCTEQMLQTVASREAATA